MEREGRTMRLRPGSVRLGIVPRADEVLPAAGFAVGDRRDLLPPDCPLDPAGVEREPANGEPVFRLVEARADLESVDFRSGIVFKL